jgi:hypothetical protein
MFALWKKKSVKENIHAMMPAWGIVLATLVVSTLAMEFAFTSGWQAIWKTLFRFLRLSALLTLPLFLLPKVCSLLEGFFNRGSRQLIQVEQERDLSIRPLKNWVIRPFQGIGLGMLLATTPIALQPFVCTSPVKRHLVKIFLTGFINGYMII